MNNNHSGFPMHKVGYTTNNGFNSCGCSSGGCSSGGSCSPQSVNVLANMRNAQNVNMNGTLEDLLSQLMGTVGTGQPLVTMDIKIANDSLLKLGFGALALMFINKEINKK